MGRPGYYQEHRKERLECGRRFCQRIKLEALQIVSGLGQPKCRCGCGDLRVLEINHLNGRPEAEKDQGKAGHWIHLEIVKGRRKTDDLEVTCHVCNSKHFVEKKFGLKYEVKFKTD
jgi:hypothetical protein